MLKNTAFTWLSLLLCCAMLVSGCRRELGPPKVEQQLLIPILKTQLGLNQLLADSISEVAEDGNVTLVYSSELISTGLSAFEELNTEEFEQTAKLKELTLSDRTVQNPISLGQIAQEDSVYGPAIIALNGNTFQIPEITGLTFGPDVMDGSDYFDEMTLDSGFMEIRIHNGLPTSISDIDFLVRNQGDQAIIAQESFAIVEPMEEQVRVADLGGKSLESYLEALVVNFDIDSSDGPVLIDTSDKITVTVVIGGLKVYSAIAVFPAQDIIQASNIQKMESTGSARIRKAVAKSGFVNVEVESTIEDTLYFDYYIPEGTKDGMPFEIHEKVPPAPSGGSIFRSFSYDVSGYEFGMTGAPLKDTFNVFYSELVGRIDSTGRKVNITLNDSLRVFVNLSGFVPEYLEGYAGDTIIEVGPTSAEFQLFSKFSEGVIAFESVAMDLRVSNGNGVPFEFDLLDFSATNTRTNESVNIDLSTIPSPIEVEVAPSLSEPWVKEWVIGESTKSFNEVLSILPNQLNATMRVATNPAQNPNDLTQFAVDSNHLSATADLTIPLRLNVQDLIFRDTLGVDPRRLQSPEGVSSGTFYLQVFNEFPFTAQIALQFIDAAGATLATLDFSESITSGHLNDPSTNQLSLDFNQALLDAISQSNYAVVEVVIDSDNDENVALLSEMNLDITLSGKFNAVIAP